jgi:hypothetical protein
MISGCAAKIELTTAWPFSVMAKIVSFFIVDVLALSRGEYNDSLGPWK